MCSNLAIHLKAEYVVVNNLHTEFQYNYTSGDSYA
jgi:hypothetical protein